MHNPQYPWTKQPVTLTLTGPEGTREVEITPRGDFSTRHIAIGSTGKIDGSKPTTIQMDTAERSTEPPFESKSTLQRLLDETNAILGLNNDGTDNDEHNQQEPKTSNAIQEATEMPAKHDAKVIGLQTAKEKFQAVWNESREHVLFYLGDGFYGNLPETTILRELGNAIIEKYAKREDMNALQWQQLALDVKQETWHNAHWIPLLRKHIWRTYKNKRDAKLGNFVKVYKHIDGHTPKLVFQGVPNRDFHYIWDCYCNKHNVNVTIYPDAKRNNRKYIVKPGKSHIHIGGILVTH